MMEELKMLRDELKTLRESEARSREELALLRSAARDTQEEVPHATSFGEQDMIQDMQAFPLIVAELKKLRASTMRKDSLIAELNEQLYYYTSREEGPAASETFDTALAAISANTQMLAAKSDAMRNSVHRMSKVQLEHHQQLSAMRDLQHLEVYGWKPPPAPVLQEALDAQSLFIRTFEGDGIRLQIGTIIVLAHTYTHARVFVSYIRLYVYVCVCVFIHMHICTFVYIYISICTYICIHLFLCMVYAHNNIYTGI